MKNYLSRVDAILHVFLVGDLVWTHNFNRKGVWGDLCTFKRNGRQASETRQNPICWK